MKFNTLLDKAASFAGSTISVRRAGTGLSTVSFREFVADVRRLQSNLMQCGLKPGHVVGLQAATRYEFLVWDLALTTAGMIPQVMPEGMTLSELLQTAQMYDLACMVSDVTGTLALQNVADPDSFAQKQQVKPRAARLIDSDVLSRVYSSGTTGRTKGLIVSRTGVERVSQEFIRAYGITDADRHLVFLPLSHFQQRLSFYACLEGGVSFMLTPYTHVFQDLPRFAPSFLVGPPAFYEAMLNVVVGKDWRVEDTGRLRTTLGPNLRFMITGMAPIRRSVLDAYAHFSVRLVEGYGITEAGLVAWNTPDDDVVGTVGRPLPLHRIEFTAESEILVHTDYPLCKGYFDSDPTDERATFLSPTCIATGDIGKLADGRLCLSGRKKDIIITGNGMKFHPSELEQLLLYSPEIRQAAVVLDDNATDIVAIICVDDATDAPAVNAITRYVEVMNSGIDTHKRVSKTVFTSERFTLENALLTRNLKPDRSAIARHFLGRTVAPAPSRAPAAIAVSAT
jgi:long-chain acyl-CoA synthetase